MKYLDELYETFENKQTLNMDAYKEVLGCLDVCEQEVKPTYVRYSYLLRLH